jgi:hypothetical protein
VRSAWRREGVSDESPKGRDATGGSMRSTTARPASPATHQNSHIHDGYTESRKASNAAFSKPCETQRRLHGLPLTRRTAKSQKRIGEQAQIRVYLFGNIRKADERDPASIR